MKHFLISASAALIATAACAPVLAQTTLDKNSREDISRQEKVVLRLDDDGKTEIHIKDGKITVNGEEVMTLADAMSGRTEKTIVIEGSPSGSFNPFAGFGEGTGPAKAALGVQFDPRTEESDGALVKEITAGSAAEKAGLKAGDLITKVDEATIRNGNDLVEAISTYKPGEEVDIAYKRGSGKTTTVKVALGEAPNSRSFSRSFRMGPDGRMQEDGGGMPNGMNGMPFNFNFPPDLGNMFGEAEPRPKLGITGEDRTESDGVTVKNVHEGSPAATTGLKKGDVITGFAGKDVASLSDLQAIVHTLKPGSTAAITYRRAGAKKTGEVKLPGVIREEEL